MRHLEGRVAWITGAGRGIGRAIALCLAREGVDLAMAARSAAQLEDAAAAARAEGVRARPYVLDVTDAAAGRAAARQIEAELGPVDILVNNAGVAESAALHRTTDDLWDRTMAVNLVAPFRLTRLVAPGMRARGWGRIVHVASTAALKGYAYTAAYTASKHGLLGLMRGQSKEYVADGVTVNAVCPGFVDTELTQAAARRIAEKTGRSLEEARRALAAESPLGRLVRPEEVARAVLALVGPDSDAFSGLAFPVAAGAVEA